jgi:uncharacterized phage infection (PIP) family protein YhgE
MVPILASVTLNALGFWILLIFSVAALLVSFYCLFFMLPEKRFWDRIQSLGGGLKGIETHVEGVKAELSGRLDALEKLTGERAEAVRQDAQSSTEKLSKADREAARELDRLRRELQSLQVELREALAGNSRLTQSVESLTSQLQQLRGDIDGLGVELRESVRQQVADSFVSVESTILSALDAVQEEMLYGISQPTDTTTPFPARRPASKTISSGADGDRQNIISMGPLFAAASAQTEDEAEEEPEAADTEEAGTDDAGAGEEEPGA